jgi:hypothetical protein
MQAQNARRKNLGRPMIRRRFSAVSLSGLAALFSNGSLGQRDRIKPQPPVAARCFYFGHMAGDPPIRFFRFKTKCRRLSPRHLHRAQSGVEHANLPGSIRARRAFFGTRLQYPSPVDWSVP